jgi:glycosyltransferase involved in cell wall biosynthesis
MKKVSIVVPVYNREKTIKKCLDSLINQTYPNVEIIVVNNNSVDGTVKIVKELIEGNPNIHLYNCKEQGVSYARNYGIKKATGDYIMFVDSDDYCHLKICEILMEKAAEMDSDIVVCGEEKRNTHGALLPPDNEKSDYHGKNPVRKLLCRPASPNAKIIKLDLIKKHDVKFLEGVWIAEDLAFVAELAAYTEKIAFVEGKYYYYLPQDDSITSMAKPEYEYHIFTALGYVYGIYDKKAQLLDKYRNEIERLFVANLVLAASMRYMLPTRDKRFYEQSRKFMRIHFPEWHKNSYYAKRGAKIKLFFFLYRHGMIMPFSKLISRLGG